MRVLQLIDSLDAGGSERMAVNLANGLSSKIDASFLCVSRKEGLLKQSINTDVSYLFLKKTHTIDFKAISKLSRFIRKNKITIIHAHGSSFFTATIVRVMNPKLLLFWHDHYGNRAQDSYINKVVLKICSYFFASIIVVNTKLKEWSEKKLLCDNVNVLANYPIINSSLKLTLLRGETGKRIVCLANLRPDKDHLNLLQAFKSIHKINSDWTLHLVGKIYEDDYYNLIREFILKSDLKDFVFFYGSCADTFHILKQSDIGVLASKSEGLPLALLEYGLAELPVVATNVGDCNKVISNTDEGFLVESGNDIALAKALLNLINDGELRQSLAQQLYLKVLSSFSESSSIELLISIYKTHLK